MHPHCHPRESGDDSGGGGEDGATGNTAVWSRRCRAVFYVDPEKAGAAGDPFPSGGRYHPSVSAFGGATGWQDAHQEFIRVPATKPRSAEIVHRGAVAFRRPPAEAAAETTGRGGAWRAAGSAPRS